MVIEAFDRVHLGGTGIDRITEDEVVAVVRDALSHGRGGRIITPNVDILRRAAEDPAARRHLDDADLIVADGMPLIWASRLGGVPLPERVAGSSLIWTLSEGLGRDTRSIFILGGTPTPRTLHALPGPASSSPDRALAALRDPASFTTPDRASAAPGDRSFSATPDRASSTAPGRPFAVLCDRAPSGAPDRDFSAPGTAAAPATETLVWNSLSGETWTANVPVAESVTRRPPAAPTSGDIVPADPAAEAPIVGGRGSAPATGVTVRDVRASGAVRAAVRLATANPGLRIAGALSPPFGFDDDENTYAEVCARVTAAQPDLVFVGLGFPRQEQVIERLRRDLPATWFVGCGAAINFVAGDIHRAPRWMQRTGLEWAHRLTTEPRRLARRYLRHDAPYALRLLARARARRRSRRA
ncbi:N-acetylglucosaminyldiphosphoundecaprenol [Actinoplanes sp. SE50]|uniref:WecB/TagA/CpsF family glycosyltransferase n=1 Tax=unclassified Actinoplanes TaxID=2626549 RepID=UPI00023EBE78|nr:MULTISPECIES: WecB/TagA/CpsF family glycosyltransferase [unclassified Actinoplanes]AEV81802.1 N-acetylglucosaminyldiphosphoundecaprenol [Actinoplanes sp. SE50/110]ATO80203.1 N-acetylglucosaminyldiphosphoundecaprenol [Actinoplanes sp. SE50]SLL97607.1 Putative N-acetylmannosaminyltransferase [Actinoplanes sp. SE50/110]